MSIVTLLNQIKEGGIVLPAIQRDFVWEQERVCALLDSILRGYPIGIVLLWETYEDIQYRLFERDYKTDVPRVYRDNGKKQRLRVVLDGQQRLQSLYVALYGTLDGESLYFDVLSGRDTDDVGQEKYQFYFGRASDAKGWNEEAAASEDPPAYWVKVQELFAQTVQDRMRFAKKLSKSLGLDDDDEERLQVNLARFDEAMTRDPNILKHSTIDENRPADSEDRKSEADVLEIFVRVNRQGMSLSRSDLVFSMLKLNWRESAEALPDFVQRINEGNTFELDADFVIRCLFAVCDLGTRFDLDLLRTKSNVEKMKQSFQRCCDAIAATVDFIQESCWCASSRLVGGNTTLIPFVYYLFHLPKHDIPNKQLAGVRKALFLFAFTRPFSRYADSRLGAFIKQELKPRLASKDYAFPLEAGISRVKLWENVAAYDEGFLQGNKLLALHLVQRKTGAAVQFKNNLPEVDHIFPRSVLKEKEYEQDQIEHVANLWILAKSKNQNKSNRHPSQYFADVADADLQRALIERDMLDYRRFPRFLKQRTEAILATISGLVGLSAKDFERTEEEEVEE